MKKRLTSRLFSSAAAIAALATGEAAAQSDKAAAAPTVEQMLEAGYVATFTCSGVFIAGRELAALQKLELTQTDATPNTVAGAAPDISIDRERKVVSVPFADRYPPMRAAFRDGLGCSVLPWGADLDGGEKLARLSKKRPTYDKKDDAWPKDGPIKPAAGAKPYQAALDAVIDRAFGREAYGAGARTIATLIVHKGEVVAERYRDGFGTHTQYRTWSTAKSLASAVVGAAIKDGVLPDVSARAPIPEWSGADDPRRAITLENLLHMASGLSTVTPDVGSDTPAAYWGGVNSSADAASRPLIHEPGAKWHYSNYDTLLLMRSLKTALGDDQAYLDFPYRRLFDRIGMHDTFAETDAYGNFVMSSQVYTNARDLARFATLYLNDGVWDGERILPEGWTEYSCTPTDAEAREGVLYGAQWWMHDLKFAPEDGVEDFRICTTSGARGQHAAFAPEHNLVIVRRGVDEFGPNGFDEPAFFADVVRAIAGKSSE